MLHLQGGIPGWKDPVPLLPRNAMVKSVQDVGPLVEAKQTNGNVFTVYRHWLPVEQQVVGSTLEENKHIARSFFNKFINHNFVSNAKYVNAIETYNEHIHWMLSVEELRRRVLFERACAEVWHNEYKTTHSELGRIKLIHANVSVGNDVPIEVAQIAFQYDNMVGYHPYTMYQGGVRNGADWAYLSGRWEVMERSWNGLKPDWAFTETGPFYDATHGWRSPLCLNENRNAYVGAMRTLIRDIQQTNAYQEGRLYGMAMFTTGDPNVVGWHYFQTHFPELTMMAEMVAEEWRPNYDPQAPKPSGELVVNRNWNLRSKPNFDNSKLYTMPAGTRLEFGGELRGALYNGSDKWYAATVYMHEYGADLAARAITSYSAISLTVPISGSYVVTSTFNAPREYGNGLHEGVDFAPRSPNAKVLAVADGIIDKVGYNENGYGHYVRMYHSNGGFYTWYGHMAQKTPLSVGDFVYQGEVLGDVGSTGRSTGAHVHLTLSIPGRGLHGYIVDDVVDPMKYIR